MTDHSARSASRLLADATAAGGALSTQRVTLGCGADGASPHLQKGSSELFFILDGSVQVLAGVGVLTLQAGDLAVVPPATAHAFAAPPGATAGLLTVITSGVGRFEYFSLLDRFARGQATRDALLAVQDRFDSHFLDSPEWRAARSCGGAGYPAWQQRWPARALRVAGGQQAGAVRAQARMDGRTDECVCLGGHPRADARPAPAPRSLLLHPAQTAGA